jgi:hypothetical protein
VYHFCTCAWAAHHISHLLKAELAGASATLLTTMIKRRAAFSLVNVPSAHTTAAAVDWRARIFRAEREPVYIYRAHLFAAIAVVRQKTNEMCA